MIRAGQHDVVVTGGMESMSNAPYLLPKARFGYRLGNGEVLDHMVFDGLTSTFDGDHMVVAGIARRARARHLPRGAGRLGGAIARARRGGAGRGRLRRGDRRRRRPRRRRGDPARHDAREARDAEARLRPRRDDDGRQRPGCERRRLVRGRVLRGVRALARPRACSRRSSGRQRSPTTSPTSRARRRRPARSRSSRRAARPPTSRASRSTRRSRRSRATRRACSASTRRSSTSTAAPIALGHPIGASGGRIVATLVHELRRSGGGLGLAAICSGGGQGDALLIEV